jgi:hypothetical protein
MTFYSVSRWRCSMLKTHPATKSGLFIKPWPTPMRRGSPGRSAQRPHRRGSADGNAFPRRGSGFASRASRFLPTSCATGAHLERVVSACRRCRSVGRRRAQDRSNQRASLTPRSRQPRERERDLNAPPRPDRVRPDSGNDCGNRRSIPACDQGTARVPKVRARLSASP